MKEQELEDQITHLLSEWLNDNAPLGEEGYRAPARSAIRKVRKALGGVDASKEALRVLNSLAIFLKKKSEAAKKEAERWQGEIDKYIEVMDKTGKERADVQLLRINLFEASGERKAFLSAWAKVKWMRSKLVKK